jgi:hypothetical protein
MILDDNQPKNDDEAAPESDPEWEAVKAITPGLQEEPEPEPEEPEQKEPVPEKEPEKEPEPEAPKVEPEKPNPEGGKPEGKRPEKYIPIDKYTDEKGQWRKTEAELKTRIAELESAAGGQEGTKANEEAVKAYAEKHGLTVEAARSEVDRVRDILKANGLDKPGQPELTEAQKAELAEAAQLKAEKSFNTEFEALAVPQLKELFPDATDKQLADAKEELSKLCLTEPFLDKSLDFIAFKSRNELKDIFEPPRKGPEVSRTAPKKGAPEYSAADFKDGKTSFDELFALDGDAQAKIVEEMDVDTYERMTRYAEKNSPSPIRRGNRAR